MSQNKQTLGPPSHSFGERAWGAVDADGAEIWDTKPTFTGESVTHKDWLKLLFYPKKFLLYRAIKKAKGERRKNDSTFRILDVGCGTGASVIDFKKMFGKTVEVYGIDVVQLQVELAQQKVKEHGVHATIALYDGVNIPFPDKHFDAIYTSDVLGHVEDVPAWLDELHKVLKPGGVLAMFSESKLGKHAYIRNYLYKRGLNVDPHAEFHISLYSKKELRDKIERAGFTIRTMLASVWNYFFLYPDEAHEKLQKQQSFFFLKKINALLFWLKKKLHPYSTAAIELCALLEMVTVGRWIESQGYIIIAEKKEET